MHYIALSNAMLKSKRHKCLVKSRHIEETKKCGIRTKKNFYGIFVVEIFLLDKITGGSKGVD